MKKPAAETKIPAPAKSGTGKMGEARIQANDAVIGGPPAETAPENPAQYTDFLAVTGACASVCSISRQKDKVAIPRHIATCCFSQIPNVPGCRWFPKKFDRPRFFQPMRSEA
ncbi:hypothetical protein LJR030_004726 [Rhizobium sp. LjRoot30]|uniref:hypothetical protein n=1 Tax=Rhizobium sp. LjRoot30 TaxID=3342320 RepID=UPI003ED022CA